MRLVYLFLLFLLLMFNYSFSQIKIEEKIKITPSGKKLSGATSADLRFVLTSNSDWGPYSSCVVKVGGSIIVSTRGNFDVTFPNTDNDFEYNINLGNTSYDFTFNIYYNGFNIGGATGPGSGFFGSGSPDCNNPLWTFYRGLDLQGVNATAIYDNNICDGGSVYWDPSANLTLTAGSVNAFFYNTVSNQIFGDTITCPYNEKDNYILLSRLPFNASPEVATTSATLLDVSASSAIEIEPNNRFYISDHILYYPRITNLNLVPTPIWYYKFPAELRIKEGNNYVSLYNAVGDSLGDSTRIFSNNLSNYNIKIDNPSLPYDSIRVKVEYEIFGNIQTDTLILTNSLIVNIDPPIVSPGDTALITVMYKDPWGSTVPIDSNIEIGVVDGCVKGNLLVDEIKDLYFENARSPIKFVASDSGIVKIKVGYTENLEISTVSKSGEKIKSGTKEKEGLNFIPHYTKITNKQLSTRSIKNYPNLETSSVNKPAGGCYIPPFFNFIAVIKTFFIKEITLQIINPQKNSNNDSITNDPKMPSVICQAKLLNYSGNVNFEWEYWVSKTYKRFDKHDTLINKNGKIKYKKNSCFDWPLLCPLVVKYCFKGNSQGSGQDEILSFWKVGFLGDSAKPIYIKAPVPQRVCTKYPDEYHELDPKDFKSGRRWHNPKANYGDTTKIIDKWDKNAGNDVFTGGDVWVKVTAKDPNGKILAIDTLSANKIVGSNPEVEAVVSIVNDNRFKAIIYEESGVAKRMNQFVAGFPNYGFPNGWGLSQLDNSPDPTELDRWNWRNNIKNGLEKFKYLIKVTNNYLEGNYEENSVIWLKNLFQLYNSPFHYSVKDLDGHFVKNSDNNATSYGEIVYNIYSQHF